MNPPDTPASPQGVQGITEHDIAQYLANNPAFFERHAELLASIQLASPHGHRAVSLQERQMQMLRERIRGLEQRIMEMIRNAHDNVKLADRLHGFTRALLATAQPAALPATLVESLQREFQIPQVALRLWNLEDTYAQAPFAQGVGEESRSFAESLATPYCGPNGRFEAVGWLAEAAAIQSVALVALRDAAGQVFGLLVLGSPDPTRYSAEMGTELLVRIGELASAALDALRG